jgi:hypothetical protein
MTLKADGLMLMSSSLHLCLCLIKLSNLKLIQMMQLLGYENEGILLIANAFA